MEYVHELDRQSNTERPTVDLVGCGDCGYLYVSDVLIFGGVYWCVVWTTRTVSVASVLPDHCRLYCSVTYGERFTGYRLDAL